MIPAMDMNLEMGANIALASKLVKPGRPMKEYLDILSFATELVESIKFRSLVYSFKEVFDELRVAHDQEAYRQLLFQHKQNQMIRNAHIKLRQTDLANTKLAILAGCQLALGQNFIL